MAKKKTRTRQGSSFLSVVGRAIGKVWSTLAGALGSSVRFLARGAKDLDPVHRRDGAGLLIIVPALANPTRNLRCNIEVDPNWVPTTSSTA